MSHHDFELCPKTYTFFYNEHERTFSLQYLIKLGNDVSKFAYQSPPPLYFTIAI